MALNDLQKKILAATLERSMVSGAELTKFTGTSNWNELAEAVKSLQSQDLVEVSGNIWDEKDFYYTTIGVRPSAKRYAYDILQK